MYVRTAGVKSLDCSIAPKVRGHTSPGQRLGFCLQQPSKILSFHHKSVGVPQVRKCVPGSKTVGRSPSLISLMVQQTSHTDTPAPATARFKASMSYRCSPLCSGLDPDSGKSVSASLSISSSSRWPIWLCRLGTSSFEGVLISSSTAPLWRSLSGCCCLGICMR
jgi:hypothetical protein